jgi:hypothetical protein
MYGRLEYILLTVMAGSDFGVYAMRLDADGPLSQQLVQLVPAFSVRHLTRLFLDHATICNRV